MVEMLQQNILITNLFHNKYQWRRLYVDGYDKTASHHNRIQTQILKENYQFSQVLLICSVSTNQHFMCAKFSVKFLYFE